MVPVLGSILQFTETDFKKIRETQEKQKQQQQQTPKKGLFF
jgi:hypothetical protein